MTLFIQGILIGAVLAVGLDHLREWRARRAQD